MKKYLGLLLGGLLLGGCNAADFNGNKTANESQFCMEYTAYHTADSQIMELEKGDWLCGEIKKKSGKLSVVIQKEDGEPVLESRDMPEGSFSIEIEEGGEYRITVEGERARGSVNFRKE